MNKYLIVTGTRPEIIKLYSIIKYCQDNNLQYYWVHTGQHYDNNMSRDIMDELGIKPNVDYSGNKGKELSNLINFVSIYNEFTHVIVQGDTNSVLAGAIAGKMNNQKVVHIEAGLRSNDKRMPEEWNRRIVDNMSDYLFCPTSLALGNVKDHLGNKYNVGNTIVDVVHDFKDKISEKKYKDYILLTLHRAENTSDKEILLKRLNYVRDIAQKQKLEIILPIHPRTEKVLTKFNIKLNKFFDNKIKVISPASYFEMLSLIKNSDLIMTDSGGIQEESSILNKPCIILRDNTERPEVLKHNCCFQKDNKIPLVKKYNNIFGEYCVAKKIMDILEND